MALDVGIVARTRVRGPTLPSSSVAEAGGTCDPSSMQENQITQCPVAHQLPLQGQWTGEFGGHRYPTRTDYESSAGKPIASMGDDQVRWIQRHWHAAGQNGCAFAQWISKRCDEGNWVSLVLDHTSERNAALMAERVGDLFEGDAQMVSILAPQLTEPTHLVEFVDHVARQRGFWLQDHEPLTGYETRQLRYQLSPNLDAWVMLFGPFDFLPETRRAPITELTFRVKAKPPWLYPLLNQDPSIAHLADFPATLRPAAWDRLFHHTVMETIRILGATPDRRSAAKMTLALPLACSVRGTI